MVPTQLEQIPLFEELSRNPDFPALDEVLRHVSTTILESEHFKQARPSESTQNGAESHSAPKNGEQKSVPGRPQTINSLTDARFYQPYSLNQSATQALVTPILDRLLQIEVVGMENLPDSGGGLLVSNHASYLDPVIKTLNMPRPMTLLGKPEMFTIKERLMSIYNELGIISGMPPGWQTSKPFLEVLTAILGDGVRAQMIEFQAVPMRKKNPVANSLKDSRAYYKALSKFLVNHLKNGELVGFYPEGRRTPDGMLRSFRGMTASLALKSKTPIIPMAITGTHGVLSPAGIISGQSFMKQVQLKVGKPIQPVDFPRAKRNKDKARKLNRLMEDRVRDLLR